MYKDNRYINAGNNEFYRYGKKAQDYVAASLEANESGYYSIATDGGKYWTIGTSEGRYGEFCKIGETIFSVNRGGYAYAKAGTEKGEAFVKAINGLLEKMKKTNEERLEALENDDEE